MLSEKGETAEGLEHLQKAVALKPESAAVRNKLAQALTQAGRFADAISQLQKSIEISGGRDWQCYDMLGTVYSKMGRPDDAIQAGRRALDLALAGQDGELVRSLRAKLAGYQQTK